MDIKYGILILNNVKLLVDIILIILSSYIIILSSYHLISCNNVSHSNDK